MKMVYHFNITNKMLTFNVYINNKATYNTCISRMSRSIPYKNEKIFNNTQ